MQDSVHRSQMQTMELSIRNRLIGASNIPIRVYRPGRTDCHATILFAHGGGFNWGTLDDYDPICMNLAGMTGSIVVSVEYRLAPDHPFPAGLDDVMAVAAALEKERRNEILGPFVVAGDSAGGCLAAGAAQIARGSRIAFEGQLLIYPMLEHYSRTPPGFHDLSKWFRPKYADIIGAWDAYLPDNPKNLPHHAIPPRGEDLTGLPPALTIVAQNDPLRFEGAAYAQQMAGYGIESKMFVVDAVEHGFLNTSSTSTSITVATMERIATWLSGFKPGR